VLYVPSELAYGDAGRADERRGQYIPSGAVLIFEIELLKCHGPTKLKPRRPIEACAADVKPAAHAVADVPSGGAPLPTCPEVPSPTASATPSLASNGSAPGAQSTDADAERLPAAGPMSVFSRILEGNQASADEPSPASAEGSAAAADAAASAAAGGAFSTESATELAGDSATESSGLFERDTYCRPTSANSTGGAASNGSSAVGSSTPKSSAKAAGEAALRQAKHEVSKEIKRLPPKSPPQMATVMLARDRYGYPVVDNAVHDEKDEGHQTGRSTRSTRSVARSSRPSARKSQGDREVQALREQLAELTWMMNAMLGAVEGLFFRMRLPTLKHALQDLGLSADGKKEDLAKRLIDAISAETPRSPRQPEWRGLR